MAKSKIKFNNVFSANSTRKIQLPKYSSRVISLANGYSKATRPANVGQVSEDIKTFRDDETLIGYTDQDWIDQHKNKYPEGIQKTTNTTWVTLQKMVQSLSTVTKEDIQKWEGNLVFSKIYDELMAQDAIVRKIAEEINTQNYRLASPEEEQRDIDGYISNHPVQVKSDAYDKTGRLHNEEVQCVIVSYQKSNKTIVFDCNPEDFQ